MSGIAPRKSDKPSNRARNYLALPVVAAYFEITEHEVYYRALKRAAQRRDFHEHLIPVAETFLRLSEPSDAMAAVDDVMASARRSRRRTSEAGVLQQAIAQHPEGVELLQLTDPLSFESLKQAYRRAARHCHPDAGGSHEAMVAINEAFNAVHLLLRMAQFTAAGGGLEDTFRPWNAPEVRRAVDYRYLCGDLLLEVTLEEWDLHAAIQWFHWLQQPSQQASDFAQHFRQQMALATPASQLAKRLTLLSRHDEAATLLAAARRFAAVGAAHGINLQDMVDGADEVVAGRRRTTVAVNHPRQAANALRLGLITEKKAAQVVERYETERRQQLGVGASIIAAYAGGQFAAELPSDEVARGKTAPSGLVPEPGYYVNRITSLSDAQQGEYLRAFREGRDAALMQKYAFVRYTSLLESALLYPDLVDIARADAEVRVLADASDGSRAHYGALVSSVLTHLQREQIEERRTRANLLGALSRRAYGGMLEMPGASGLGIALTEEYFDLVTRPVQDLEHYVRLGTLPARARSRR